MLEKESRHLFINNDWLYFLNFSLPYVERIMKAKLWQNYVLLVIACAWTIWTSIKAIALVFMGTFTRDWADRHLRIWANYLLNLARIKTKVINPHHFNFVPGERYIVMSNHNSHFDIPLIFHALPGSIRMVTKRDLFKIPIFGKGMMVAEFIPIDRENHHQAVRDMELAKLKLEDGIIVWVSPEGTRAKMGELLPFKKGGFVLAIQTKAKILPIGIRGSGRILPPKTWELTFDQQVEIHIGQPIDASLYNVNNKEVLMHEVGTQLRKLLGYSLPEENRLNA